MFGSTRTSALALAGWLWADLLLGMFALFLAANTAGAPVARAAEGIDPRPLQLELAIDGIALLSADAAVSQGEQQRIAAEIERALADAKETRRAALVLAFGTHASPAEGDRIAELATGRLRDTRFAGGVVRAYHELAADDPGTRVSLEIYFFQ